MTAKQIQTNLVTVKPEQNLSKTSSLEINPFLEKNKQLYQFQFGFRSKHSTSHVLISLTEKIRAVLDKNLLACRVFRPSQSFRYSKS